MVKHIVFRIIAGVILLAAIAGIAFFAYQAGVTHGAAENVQAVTAGATGSTYPLYAMPFPFFWWFPGFGFLGLLIPIFLFFLAFGMIRRLIWGPRWGWRHMRRESMEHGPWGNDVPPMFKEWHRRAHASQSDDQAANNKPEQ